MAIDGSGQARPVPPLDLQAEDEVRRWREAEIRRAHRLAGRREIDDARGVTP
ncbi:MAG TPA: hypothetical protein VN088_01680 [Nocardioides sp.]|nr:hypothetical protein [Nocardioides sp.]